MTYVELPPSAPLREWVECYWMRPAAASPSAHRVLPDGCADIVFDLDNASAYAVGTMTRPLLLESVRSPAMIGVRFRPGRAAALLGLTLRQITDTRAPLADVWPRSDLAEIAATAASPVEALERELLRRVARAGETDRRVDAAIDRIVRSGGRVSIERLADDIGISRQHLARRFLIDVGVSPKSFARVMRFRRVLRHRAAIESWSDAAIRFGYYDQAHLIADFRELAGDTPFHFSNRSE
jgi:AraC-like DNA-binding protein